jgi:hypothetical protein
VGATLKIGGGDLDLGNLVHLLGLHKIDCSLTEYVTCVQGELEPAIGNHEFGNAHLGGEGWCYLSYEQTKRPCAIFQSKKKDFLSNHQRYSLVPPSATAVYGHKITCMLGTWNTNVAPLN